MTKMKTSELIDELVKAPMLDEAPHHEALCSHLTGDLV